MRADSPEADETAVRITRQGGMEAEESADGRFVYYSKRGRSGIWRLPADDAGGAPEEKVLDAGGQGRWSLRPEGIFVLDAGPVLKPAIRFFEFATNRLSDVVALPGDWNIGQSATGIFAVSPDAQWALVADVGLDESDIMLAENFR